MTNDELVAVGLLRNLMQEEGRVREIRESAGVSRAEVAAVVGVSADAVAQWELQRRRPTGDRALRYALVIADLAGVPA